jgi:biotin transport system substrate-specific component
MLNARGSAPTVAEHLWTASTPAERAVRMVVLAVAGSLLMWASAKVQVPFYPVPMTMQTAVAFLIGIAYGPRLGAATIALYLAQGAMGMPVFAGTPEKGIGLPYMIGPTGGYLLGFAVAAAITGWVAERSSHWLAIGTGVLVATAAIYVLGAGWLATMIGFEKAVTFGIVPFLPGDLVKLLLVTALAATGLGALRRRV